MLLILSNSLDATTDYLVEVLRQKEVEHLRFDTDRCLEMASVQYAAGTPWLGLAERWYAPAEFENVWYRRPERLKLPRDDASAESKVVLDEWAEALEGFFSHIPSTRWMNHPSANVAASHKLEQLTTAARLGFTVPRTLVTQDPAQLRQFHEASRGEIIVKPMATGYIERQEPDADTIIYTSRVDRRQLDDLADLYRCPTLFQEYIPKSSDVRITVVDAALHAVELKATDMDGRQRCDIRRNNMADVGHRRIVLPGSVERNVRMLTAHYGLRFAAIDMAVTTDGNWIFFEVNPNGQWAWMDLTGATNIAESFIQSFSKGGSR